MTDFRTLFDQLTQLKNTGTEDGVPDLQAAEKEYRDAFEQDLVKKGYLLLARKQSLSERIVRSQAELRELDEQIEALPNQFDHSLKLKSGESIKISSEPGGLFQSFWADVQALSGGVGSSLAVFPGKDGAVPPDSSTAPPDHLSAETNEKQPDGVVQSGLKVGDVTPVDSPIVQVTDELPSAPQQGDPTHGPESDEALDIADISAIDLEDLSLDLTDSSSTGEYARSHYDVSSLADESDELLDYL